MSLEVVANLVVVSSILLATMNSWHTWWTGVIGCLLFARLFLQTKLYAEVTLQGFFIATSFYGWWHWQRGERGRPAPIRRSTRREIIALVPHSRTGKRLKDFLQHDRPGGSTTFPRAVSR